MFSYSEAVKWIALNDGPGVMDLDAIKSQLTVCMLADLYCKSEKAVARAIINIRKTMNDGCIRCEGN